MITYTEVTADSGARALFPIILTSKNMAEVKLYIPVLHESGYWRIKDINKAIDYCNILLQLYQQEEEDNDEFDNDDGVDRIFNSIVF